MTQEQKNNEKEEVNICINNMPQKKRKHIGKDTLKHSA